jgi:hypothetical protein
MASVSSSTLGITSSKCTAFSTSLTFPRGPVSLKLAPRRSRDLNARTQSDIDLHPERYTHYYKKEFPKRFDAMMDTRRWGPGERLVFEPYTKEMFESAYQWIAQHEIFPKDKMGSGIYEESVVSLAVD